MALPVNSLFQSKVNSLLQSTDSQEVEKFLQKVDNALLEEPTITWSWFAEKHITVKIGSLKEETPLLSDFSAYCDSLESWYHELVPDASMRKQFTFSAKLKALNDYTDLRPLIITTLCILTVTAIGLSIEDRRV